MPSHEDARAGSLIRELRCNQGLSPEALSHAIYAAGIGSVSGKTIRRIEAGMVPTVRVQFALSAFFDRQVVSIWPPAVRVAA